MKSCGVCVRGLGGKDVEIWIPRGTDEATIQAVADIFMDRGSRVVLYRSGTGDAAALTAELLRVNL